MLTKLISRIKSDQKQSSHKQIPKTKQESIKLNKPLIPQPVLMDGIQSIWYTVVDDMPDIKQLILSCPLKFNQLQYSKRQVKQVNLQEHYPEYLKFLIETFSDYIHEPNHVLINRYPKSVGIMHHFDGPLYYPKVTVYSIGNAIIEFKKQGESYKMFLEDKSLHIFEKQAYTSYMHGIEYHGVDCIFFKIQFTEDKSIVLLNSSVINFRHTNLFKRLSKLLTPGTEYLTDSFWELSIIKDNPTYNYKLEIPRQQRISLTIRHKYN